MARTETLTDGGDCWLVDVVITDDETGAVVGTETGIRWKPGTPAAIAEETLAANADTRDLLRGAAVLIADGTSTAPVSDQMMALGRLALLEAAFADGIADQAVL